MEAPCSPSPTTAMKRSHDGVDYKPGRTVMSARRVACWVKSTVPPAFFSSRHKDENPRGKWNRLLFYIVIPKLGHAEIPRERNCMMALREELNDYANTRVHRKGRLRMATDENLHGSGMSHATTASSKAILRGTLEGG